MSAPGEATYIFFEPSGEEGHGLGIRPIGGLGQPAKGKRKQVCALLCNCILLTTCLHSI